MTEITEEEYEKKININKFDFNCDDEDCTIPEPLPRKSFSMLICGLPGSGKTNLLLNLNKARHSIKSFIEYLYLVQVYQL